MTAVTPADMRRPDAVLITPAMPSDRGNGLAMRAGLLLEGLARSFTVKLLVVPVFRGMETRTPLAEDLASEIRVVELDPEVDMARDVIRRLAWPGGRALVSAVHPLPGFSAGMTAAVAEALAAELVGAAVVLTLRSYLLPLLDVLLGTAARPKVLLDVDDVESVLHRELGRPDEADRFERLEAHYLPLVDGVIACSSDDAALLRARLALRTVAVIPNAIRPPENPPPLRASLYDLLFVGNLSYEPNIEAALWLCQDVLPHLPDVRLAIVGSRPAPAVRMLARTGRVTVVPDVEAVETWYERSSVAVVPVLHGGGSRIKLIEALAHGRPVVATAVGAAGQPWAPSQSPVVVADTAESFASACRELLDDFPAARRIGVAGQALVRATASVEVVAPQIDRLVLSMFGR